MAVMGVWAFIQIVEWTQMTESKRTETMTISPEQKTKKSFVLRHLCPGHEVLTGIWTP